MIDETTGCTVVEQLAVHARYIDINTGDLKTQFLNVIDIDKFIWQLISYSSAKSL